MTRIDDVTGIEYLKNGRGFRIITKEGSKRYENSTFSVDISPGHKKAISLNFSPSSSMIETEEAFTCVVNPDNDLIICGDVKKDKLPFRYL